MNIEHHLYVGSDFDSQHQAASVICGWHKVNGGDCRINPKSKGGNSWQYLCKHQFCCDFKVHVARRIGNTEEGKGPYEIINFRKHSDICAAVPNCSSKRDLMQDKLFRKATLMTELTHKEVINHYITIGRKLYVTFVSQSTIT